jgi:hypothetical protein
MKRLIAMRCTQEQWDSIKDRIGLKIHSITDFKEYPYLINFDTNNSISNINKEHCFGFFWQKNPAVYETFNTDIFLEACGEEVEKVWKGSEVQYSIGTEWYDFRDVFKFRIKPQPDYSQEIEALQTKAKENGMKAVITFEKL